MAAEPIYQRLVRDLTAIRQLDSRVDGIGFFPVQHDGKTLVLNVDSSAISEMEDDDYDPWECLNRKYGVTDITVSRPGLGPDFWAGNARLTFKGTYNMEQLVQQYSSLPGVFMANAYGKIGDGSTICIGREKNDTWHYVLKRKGGDCLAGCTTMTAYYYFTPKDQPPQFGGMSDGSEEAAPDWYMKYAIEWPDDVCQYPKDL